MSINVEGGGLTEVFLLWHPPEQRCPSCKSIGQGFSPIRLGQLGEQPFRVEVAVGAFATTEQRERITCVAAQIPGPTKPDDSQKEQRQHQHPTGGGREVGEARVRLLRARRQGGVQGRKQTGFLRRCYQEESTGRFLPVRFL
ncbi:MAG TPA: hypothetical protein VF844_18905 [Ktedonobacteraceae bacterium]